MKQVDMRRVRLSAERTVKRRRVKFEQHDPNRKGQLLYWCCKCERYTYSLVRHTCGTRARS